MELSQEKISQLLQQLSFLYEDNEVLQNIDQSVQQRIKGVLQYYKKNSKNTNLVRQDQLVDFQENQHKKRFKTQFQKQSNQFYDEKFQELFSANQQNQKILAQINLNCKIHSQLTPGKLAKQHKKSKEKYSQNDFYINENNKNEKNHKNVNVNKNELKKNSSKEKLITYKISMKNNQKQQKINKNNSKFRLNTQNNHTPLKQTQKLSIKQLISSNQKNMNGISLQNNNKFKQKKLNKQIKRSKSQNNNLRLFTQSIFQSNKKVKARQIHNNNKSLSKQKYQTSSRNIKNSSSKNCLMQSMKLKNTQNSLKMTKIGNSMESTLNQFNFLQSTKKRQLKSLSSLQLSSTSKLKNKNAAKIKQKSRQKLKTFGDQNIYNISVNEQKSIKSKSKQKGSKLKLQPSKQKILLTQYTDISNMKQKFKMIDQQQLFDQITIQQNKQRSKNKIKHKKLNQKLFTQPREFVDSENQENQEQNFFEQIMKTSEKRGYINQNSPSGQLEEQFQFQSTYYLNEIINQINLQEMEKKQEKEELVNFVTQIKQLLSIQKKKLAQLSKSNQKLNLQYQTQLKQYYSQQEQNKFLQKQIKQAQIKIKKLKTKKQKNEAILQAIANKEIIEQQELIQQFQQVICELKSQIKQEKRTKLQVKSQLELISKKLQKKQIKYESIFNISQKLKSNLSDAFKEWK